MEKNWEQLIDRYLMNELSPEGKQAFEEELNSNPSLAEAMSQQLFVMETFERKAQRNAIQQLGKSYHFKAKWKYWSLGIGSVIGAGLIGMLMMGKGNANQTPASKTELATTITDASSTDSSQNSSPIDATKHSISLSDSISNHLSVKDATKISGGEQLFEPTENKVFGTQPAVDTDLSIHNKVPVLRNVFVFRYSDGNLLSMPKSSDSSKKQVVMDLVLADFDIMSAQAKGKHETDIAMCFDGEKYFYMIGYDESEDEFEDFLITKDLRNELGKKLTWTKAGTQQLEAVLKEMEAEYQVKK